MPALARPVAVALADRAGSVDAGVVDAATLLRPDPAAPFGRRFDGDAMVTATDDALRRADVVAVDAGDLDRAVAFGPLAFDPAGTAARRAALRRTDALLGRISARLPADTLLLVVSVVPPGNAWRLTPMVAVGGGVPHGWVVSPSVKRLGVVTLTDVAPTVLDALGAPVPDGMVGHGFRYHAGTPDVATLGRLDRDAHYREVIYLPVAVGYIVVQALVYLVAMLVLTRRRDTGRAEAWLRTAVVAIAAFPLATFVFRAVPGVAALGGTAVGILVALDAAITAIALRARRHPLSPLSWIVWLTTALIVVDVSSGARLQYSSLLGYSLHTASRFFGIGNTAFGALAACTALAAAVHVHYAPRRRDALLVVTALILVVTVADGAPTLGDDVGGILTLVPVLGLALVALWGRRLSWRSVLAVLGGLAAALGLAVGADLARPASSRTHLSNFVVDLVSGNGQSGTTIARKLATNVRVLGASVWTWMVPIVALFLLFLLVYEDRAADLLPRGSALRVGVVSALAAGLVGFALNDSGVVVTAIAFVYLGPVLTLLALATDRGEPVLWAPSAAPSPP